MASFKSHPIFYTALIFAGALTAGQAWLLVSNRSAIAKVSADIEQKRQELDAFASQNPFPSKENVEALEADRIAIEATRDAVRASLRSTSDVAKKIETSVPPSSRTDAYFDIANYIEQLRAHARTAGVGFSPENRFGFSAYSSTGPEPALIPAVFKQRLYAEYLIGALLTSTNPPRDFIGLQREQPLSAEQRQQVADAVAQGQQPPVFGDTSSPDYFVIDPQISARVEGFVSTIPFRLTFVGNTAVLRAFLNELAQFKVSAVVRSVEVESLSGSNSDSGARSRPMPPPPPARRNNPFGGLDGPASDLPAVETVKPLVEQVDSRFVVTVEIVALVDKNAQSEAGTIDGTETVITPTP